MVLAEADGYGFIDKYAGSKSSILARIAERSSQMMDSYGPKIGEILGASLAAVDAAAKGRR
jgi:hypothetical protein